MRNPESFGSTESGHQELGRPLERIQRTNAVEAELESGTLRNRLGTYLRAALAGMLLGGAAESASAETFHPRERPLTPEHARIVKEKTGLSPQWLEKNLGFKASVQVPNGLGRYAIHIGQIHYNERGTVQQKVMVIDSQKKIEKLLLALKAKDTLGAVYIEGMTDDQTDLHGLQELKRQSQSFGDSEKLYLTGGGAVKLFAEGRLDIVGAETREANDRNWKALEAVQAIDQKLKANPKLEDDDKFLAEEERTNKEFFASVKGRDEVSVAKIINSSQSNEKQSPVLIYGAAHDVSSSVEEHNAKTNNTWGLIRISPPIAAVFKKFGLKSESQKEK